MAWKGATNDTEIYWNDRGKDGHWTSQQKVGGARTSGRPSLAASHGRLYLAWKGVGNGGAPIRRSARRNPDVHSGSDIYWTSSR
jgi:hypothetical protein